MHQVPFNESILDILRNFIRGIADLSLISTTEIKIKAKPNITNTTAMINGFAVRQKNNQTLYLNRTDGGPLYSTEATYNLFLMSPALGNN